MAMPEGLSAFFDEADFAESLLLDGVAVLGIFDHAVDDALGMATAAPRVRLPSAACAGVTAASTLLARGATYRVRPPVRHDGTGLAMLWLELQT